jgi:uncharacterized protein (DUF302 family)
MKILQALLLTFSLSWITVVTADSFHFDENEYSITTFASVSETVDSVKNTLKDQGMEIIGVIDHAANATKVGLELAPSQLILFRDHQLEKKLVHRSSTVSIDLPLKILVYEDPETGSTQLIYNSTGYISDRHGIRARDQLLARLNKKLSQFGQLDHGLISIETEHSVKETVEKLMIILQDNGFSIPFIFDYTKLSDRGPSQLLIFGNPSVGTRLMQNQQSIGLDLPLKFLVWNDHEDQVHISYNDPKFLGKRHNLQGLDEMLSNIANRLQQLANAGAEN